MQQVKENNFKNKDNSLTWHAMNCGYIHKCESQPGLNGIEIKFYKEPACSVFQVIAFDFDNHKRMFWESFDSISEARIFYIKQCKVLLNKTKKECLK